MCALQELETEEVLKQLKYIEMVGLISFNAILVFHLVSYLLLIVIGVLFLCQS